MPLSRPLASDEWIVVLRFCTRIERLQFAQCARACLCDSRHSAVWKDKGPCKWRVVWQSGGVQPPPLFGNRVQTLVLIPPPSPIGDEIKTPLQNVAVASPPPPSVRFSALRTLDVRVALSSADHEVLARVCSEIDTLMCTYTTQLTRIFSHPPFFHLQRLVLTANDTPLYLSDMRMIAESPCGLHLRSLELRGFEYHRRHGDQTLGGLPHLPRLEHLVLLPNSLVWSQQLNYEHYSFLARVC
jgi:hypothetical protein